MPLSLNYKPDSHEASLLNQRNFTCQCCGFKSRSHKRCLSGYMEIVKVEGIHYCLCSICATSQKVSRNIQFEDEHSCHGLIIFCPDLTQGQITQLVRFQALSYIFEKGFADASFHLFANLKKDKRLLVSGEFHPVFKDAPGSLQVFSSLYKSLSPKALSAYSTLFSGIRYLPDPDPFDDCFKFWAAANKEYVNRL